MSLYLNFSHLALNALVLNPQGVEFHRGEQDTPAAYTLDTERVQACAGILTLMHEGAEVDPFATDPSVARKACNRNEHRCAAVRDDAARRAGGVRVVATRTKNLHATRRHPWRTGDTGYARLFHDGFGNNI